MNSTTVYPSPRTSFRVPFGTGASIRKLSDEKSSTFMTYNILAFKELRTFFRQSDGFYKSSPEQAEEIFNLIPPGLGMFLDKKEFINKMDEIRNNTSGKESFQKRFFGWFNMFRVVKYLNYVHLNFFEKKPVDISALELLEMNGGIFESKNSVDLLLYYRSLERNK